MSRYRNNGLDYFSAARFSERGGVATDIKKVKSLSDAVMANRNFNFTEFIKDISSDYTITPREKIGLEQEWNYIKASQVTITNMVNKAGVQDSQEYIEYINAYNEIEKQVTPILADMNTSSPVGDEFYANFKRYEEASSTLNIYMSLLNNNLVTNLMSIKLFVKADESSINPGDSVTLTANIYLYEEGKPPYPLPDSIKELYKDEFGNYPKLYMWSVSGTNRDSLFEEEFAGKDTMVISSNTFTGNSISVSFDAEMVVS